tara:strand:+ start:276 stop:485 length:210 start_codon:yes stop_codon:yes gene_type:complete
MQSNTQKFIRAKDIAHRYSIGKSTVHKWVAEGKLPQGKKLSPKCTVWNIAEIENAFNDMTGQERVAVNE